MFRRSSPSSSSKMINSLRTSSSTFIVILSVLLLSLWHSCSPVASELISSSGELSKVFKLEQEMVKVLEK